MNMNIKKWIIIFGIIFIFGISVFCGFLISSAINFSKKKEGNMAILAENNIQENSVKTNYSEVTVSPNCKVIITQNFKKCGHTISQNEDAPRDIINLNKEKVQEYYSGWDIRKFSSDEIELYKESNGICNEHYILGELDGYISISTKNDIGESIFKGLTDIPVQYLPEEDLQRLEDGIEVVGKENLNKILEDFE